MQHYNNQQTVLREDQKVLANSYTGLVRNSIVNKALGVENSYVLLALQSTDSSLLVTLSSLHIEFYELYWRIFSLNPIICTDPDLNVIGCGRRQLYIEPWW